MAIPKLGSFQFISPGEIPSLIRGVQSGSITTGEALNAFGNMGFVIDEYVRAVPHDMNLNRFRNIISQLPWQESSPDAGTQILDLLVLYPYQIECAIQLANEMAEIQSLIGGAVAVGNDKAPYDLGEEWKWIPSGNFLMGSSFHNKFAPNVEKPLKVVLTGGFYMLDHLSTNAELSLFYRANGFKDKRILRGEIFANSDDPAIGVKQWESALYSVWLGEEVSRQTGYAVDGHLPSEEQWEKAAKGPSGYEFIFPAPWQNEGYINGYGLRQLFDFAEQWTSTEGIVRGVKKSSTREGSEPMRAAFRLKKLTDRDYNVGIRPILVPKDIDK